MSEENKNISRRNFLKNTGMVTSGVVGGSLLGGFVTNQFMTGTPPTDVEETDDYREARMFFKREEDFKILEATVERIYPKDDNGPGAIGLRVPYFIDSQLAGDFGSNRKDYMQGPYQKVDNVNTYQTLMSRGDVYIEGLRTINSISENDHDVPFYEADNEQQDTIIEALQNGNIEMDGVSSQTFFNLLKQMTIEGAYSDPLYGGNKGMQGWKMREYPGARASYIDKIESKEFLELDPVSLKDYQP